MTNTTLPTPTSKSMIVPLVQRAIDLACTASDWMTKASLEAHDVGLQGEKRRLRSLSREAGFIIDKLSHSARDIYFVKLHPAKGTTDVSTLKCTESTMLGIISKLWTIHDEFHRIANEMVVNLNRSMSLPIYCYCDEIMTILSELQRNHESYARGEYEWHHVSRHQESDHNIHDCYEGKEESQGYKDHK